MARKPAKRRVLVVTGLSGAGLSTALKSLEDLGYKAIDNLPLGLVDALLRQKQGQGTPIAIGIDSRTWDFTPAALLKQMDKLKKDKSLQAELVFINCQDSILQQRYTETRRVHPLAVDRPVSDGVIRERQLMTPLRRAAGHVIDTSDLKAFELRRIMASYFQLEQEKGLFVFVTSFGFKNGIPREADLVFDVRFLHNPHWDAHLRPLSGLDPAVAKKVRSDKAYKGFYTGVTKLLAPLLPRYINEGKNYLTVAVGCTGGRHRSVCVAEELHRWVSKRGFSTAVRHRDLEKDPAARLQTAHGHSISRRKQRKIA
ncbi:MAG: RNase adapter RapZ [Alphaproteobacteria bacterium]